MHIAEWGVTGTNAYEHWEEGAIIDCWVGGSYM